MINNYDNFGAFVVEKRLRPEVALSLRKIAEKMNYSAPFWSDVEKNRKNPPEKDKLDELAEILKLTAEEKILMFELASKSKKFSIPPDLPDYINANENIKSMIRTAKEYNVPDNFWLEINKQILKKFGNQTKKAELESQTL